jgi:hypothetical protein
MSAGTGIFHSEYNLENEDTNLYQIWITPHQQNVKPRWASCEFPIEATEDMLNLLVSGDGKAPLYIQQNAFIYGGNLPADTEIEHNITHQAYVLVSSGSIDIGGLSLQKGDGLEVTDTSFMNITAKANSQVLVIDAP